MGLEDVYDVMLALVQHAARTGLGEAIVGDAVRVLEAADPKIAEKKRAAAAAAEQHETDWAAFKEFQAYQAQQAAQRAQPPAASPAPSVPASGAAVSVPPVVTG